MSPNRRFAYNEQGHEEPVVVDEDELRRTYWPYWLDEMRKARERGSPNSLYAGLTWENCLEDWIVVNWAWEVTDEK